MTFIPYASYLMPVSHNHNHYYYLFLTLFERLFLGLLSDLKIVFTI